MDVCMLSMEEAGRLEHYDVWPKCRHHRHVKRREADALAEAGTHRYLGGEGAKHETHFYLVPVSVQIWQPVACHDWDGRPLMGMRTWGAPGVK
jgi:hypothetical protein